MERWKWWRWGRWCWWLAWGWRDANTGWRVPWTGKPRRTWEFRQQASKSCVCWKISLTDNNENDNLILSNEKTLTTSPPASPRGRPARRRRRWKPRWRRGLPTPVFFMFIHFLYFIFLYLAANTWSKKRSNPDSHNWSGTWYWIPRPEKSHWQWSRALHSSPVVLFTVEQAWSSWAQKNLNNLMAMIQMILGHNK